MTPTPAALRARDDAVAVGDELREIEVAMVVDEHHAVPFEPFSFAGFSFFGFGSCSSGALSASGAT